VRRAVAALPQGQREVIELHWFEGLAFQEVGAILGASTTAVKVRAHRGYERLRATLRAHRSQHARKGAAPANHGALPGVPSHPEAAGERPGSSPA
ncbi:MAG: sigma factor-like helix-turn-helix DNA-binding protein, partial [Myxococcota bacterium]